MSLDSPSTSKTQSQGEVISKYFTAGKPVMDESLSDFKEKKNTFTGPKNATKASVSKPKAKKNIKRIRGQKDIRTALKKNELVTYSNDFEKICKQSGIDVDSEQLQLAIALSKSLQTSENKVDDTGSSAPLSSQERTGKIRTTLQEYGFVVPEIKITATKSKRLKKYRKNYKLLQTSQSEKQQIISDKYTQILFSNFDNSKVAERPDTENNCAKLYHIVTDIPYLEIKSDNIFYVEDLIEQSTHTEGCLLKDWADIPGRPKSPTCENLNIDFSRIDCSQEELDIILSSSLKSAQEIAKSKYNLLSQETLVDNLATSDSTTENNRMDVDCINIDECDSSSNAKKVRDKKDDPVEITEIDAPDILGTSENVRSYSPDIFDDEVSCIVENSKHSYIQSQDNVNENTTKVCNDVMDLTECVPLYQSNLSVKPSSQLSQPTNVTKRQSNDFMEITDCIGNASQPLKDNVIEENVDLTQNCSNEDEVAAIVENKSTEACSEEVENVDLTQSSDSSDELPFVSISGKDDLDDTIILNDNDYIHLGNKQCNIKNKPDIPENNKKETIEGIIKLSINSKPIIIDSEDEVEHESNSENNRRGERAISPIECIDSNSLRAEKEIPPLNVTDKLNRSSLKSDQNTTKTHTESFFEEFVYHHSDGSEKQAEDIFCVDESTDNSIKTGDEKADKIDLTQITDSSENTNDKLNNSPVFSDFNNLGKVDNVSIDYDEMFDDMVKSHASSASKSKSMSLKSSITDYNNENSEIPTKSNSDLVSNSSQTSEVFEISDKELDYSMHKSKFDTEVPRGNFHFGGISVMDNLSDIARQSNTFKRSLNRSLSDSCLPAVEIKGTIPSTDNRINSTTKSSDTVSSTPFKSPRKSCNITKTPQNSEYIIKTDQITPMLNYEAMDTPERNAELDKYGLKPFKRKRAIQLLTHLYNQTHPVVASCSKEDLPSPSKKLKPNSLNNEKTSPKKISDLTKSKTTKSPKKSHITSQKVTDSGELDKENASNIYEDTNFIPDIKEIYCCEEDWVFQKREKARVHTCRVPLHIAFHNYVTARPRLFEAILRYEPVNIDVIHKGLVADGYRYDPKDLLKFMDKKCITVKTADNNARNRKHY